MASTQQLTATLNYASGKNEPVTDSATWSSSDPDVATVSATGLVSAVGEGTCTITATSNGFSDTCTVTVTDTVEGLTVTPESTEIETA